MAWFTAGPGLAKLAIRRTLVQSSSNATRTRMSGFLSENHAVQPLGYILSRLEEYLHIADHEICNCLRDKTSTSMQYNSQRREVVLDRLLWSTRLENFLATKWTATKRFGLEGAENFIQPSFTQPKMCKVIGSHPSQLEICHNKLVESGSMYFVRRALDLSRSPPRMPSFGSFIRKPLLTRPYTTSKDTFEALDDTVPSKDCLPTIYDKWIVVMDFAEHVSDEEMKNTFVRIASELLGSSQEEAEKKIYKVETKKYWGFHICLSEDLAKKFVEIPGVFQVLPDSFVAAFQATRPDGTVGT